jgi:ubiquinone/menaquinone biosynthesis C-methylase UbiE
MFAKTAQYYDLIYSFKNYEKETQQIVDLIAREHPTARSVLDVACGTAEHAKYLSRTFQVDGIDIQPKFVEIARGKVPSGRFWVADMRDFDVSGRYDVVQCLFSSIGFLKQSQDVVRALLCFKKHLNPGGIVIVEPWFTPDQWQAGLIPHMVTVDRPDLKICRMSATGREGTISKIRFHYLVGRVQGVEHLTEDHELALYTLEEMLRFFQQAGLAARYDPEGIFGRGLYVAQVEERC